MPREEIIAGDQENIIGALVNALARPAQLARSAAGGGWRAAAAAPGTVIQGPQFTSAAINAQVGGGQRDTRLRSYLGFGTFAFTDAAPTHKFIVEPQEAFRGGRLIITQVRSAAAGGIMMLNNISVGTLPQSPSTEFGAPADGFAPDATSSELDIQLCPAGTKLAIDMEVVGAVGEGDSILVGVMLYGEWVRS